MGTHGIHIHLLDEAGILQRLLTCKRTSCLRPDAMAVDALHHEFAAVQIDAVTLAELDGAEADTLLMFVNDLAIGREQFQMQGIEMRMLRVPCADILPARFHHLTGCSIQGNRLPAISHGNLQVRTLRKMLRMKPEPQQAILLRIHLHALNMLTGNSLQPYWTENAAKEPHVVDFANFLNSMGANIKGAGTDVIRIQGVEKLHGTEYAIIPDQIEAGTFMLAAAATRGDITIKNVIPKHLESISAKLIEMGCQVHESFLIPDFLRICSLR